MFTGSSCTTQTQTPWGSNAGLCCDVEFATQAEEDAAFLEARMKATERVDELTGGLYGFHTDRIMPCTKQCGCLSECAHYGSVNDWNQCCEKEKLFLPLFPVCAITQVVIDCQTQTLDNYRIFNGWSRRPYVLKTDGGWPSQNCDTIPCDPANPTADNGWWVEYSYGREVPLLGHDAVNALACEYVLEQCAPDKCSLPKGTTQVTRQGVSINISDSDSFFKQGLTGIAKTDSFIRSVNPNGLKSNAIFVGPDNLSREYVRPGVPH